MAKSWESPNWGARAVAPSCPEAKPGDYIQCQWKVQVAIEFCYKWNLLLSPLGLQPNICMQLGQKCSLLSGYGQLLNQQFWVLFTVPTSPRRGTVRAPAALPVPAQHFLGLLQPWSGPRGPFQPHQSHQPLPSNTKTGPVSSSPQPCLAMVPLPQGGTQCPELGLSPETLSRPDHDPTCRGSSWPCLYSGYFFSFYFFPLYEIRWIISEPFFCWQEMLRINT